MNGDGKDPFFAGKEIYLQQIATNFIRENYLHTEQGNCQSEEQSICCGQEYNYLTHPNPVGHKVLLSLWQDTLLRPLTQYY